MFNLFTNFISIIGFYFLFYHDISKKSKSHFNYITRTLRIIPEAISINFNFWLRELEVGKFLHVDALATSVVAFSLAYLIFILLLNRWRRIDE